MRINVPSTSTMMDTSCAWFVYAGKIKVRYLLNCPHMTGLLVIVAPARSVSRGSNEAMTLLYLVPCPSTLTYSENTSFEVLWLSPLTRIHVTIADSYVLPLLFLKSLSILSGCPVINIHSCHQDRRLSWVGPMEYHPHTGFHYSKVLSCMFHDYVSFINISGMYLDGSG